MVTKNNYKKEEELYPVVIMVNKITLDTLDKIMERIEREKKEYNIHQDIENYGDLISVIIKKFCCDGEEIIC